MGTLRPGVLRRLWSRGKSPALLDRLVSNPTIEGWGEFRKDCVKNYCDDASDALKNRGFSPVVQVAPPSRTIKWYFPTRSDRRQTVQGWLKGARSMGDVRKQDLAARTLPPAVRRRLQSTLKKRRFRARQAAKRRLK